MSAPPLVSVVICGYQAERWIEQAVTSMLVQTWRELEVVVVDDGSTDATSERVAAIRDSRVRLVRLEQNVGVGAAANAGLAASSGELVARLDADDYAFPHRLERQVTVMRADPSIAALGSGNFIVHADRVGASAVFRPTTGALLHYALHLHCPMMHPSVVLRRACLPPHGYRPLRRGEDYQLWIDLLVAGRRLENLPEPLFVYRRHPRSITARAPPQPPRGTIRHEFLRGLGLEVSLASVRAWIDQPSVEASPRELRAIVQALSPDRVALRRAAVPVWPDWRPGERAAAWRMYARHLGRLLAQLRRHPRLAAAVLPTASEALARALSLTAANR